MSTFKKSKLVAALGAAGCALVAGQASAVYVNDGGLGEALIYPYYTVRGGNVTLLSVVNTTNQAKVVKVRFREGKNTSDVLDFNLFLSEFDVWTGAVLPADATAAGTGGARLFSNDTSCTNPTADEVGNTFRTGIPFRPFDFPAPSSATAPRTNPPRNDDGTTSTVDRVREGYIEIIEIGEILNSTSLGKDVTHGAGSATAPRTPACKIASGLAAGSADAKQITAPTGGLFGNVTVVNAATGGATAVDATALADFWGTIVPPYTDAADDQPNLGSGDPRSVVVDGETIYVSQWNNGDGFDGFRATTAVLMRDTIYNEYAYTDDKVFNTDWVVTMPNKRYFVNQGTTASGPNAALLPFQNPYVQDRGSCDTVLIGSYDREEGRSVTRGSFSPRPPGAAPDSLCWESNVIGFGRATDAAEPSRVLGSTNNLWLAAYQNNGNPVPTAGAAPQGEGGWARLTFARPGGVHQLVNTFGVNTVVNTAGVTANPTSVTYFGLPVVGFSATVYNQGARASYGTSVNHRYARSIATSAILVN